MRQPAVVFDAAPVLDVQTIRDRARTQLRNGAVTPNHGADRDVVARPLNEALATEIVSVLSYRRQCFAARICGSPDLVADRDPAARRLPGDLLAVREQHARSLVSLAEEVSLRESTRAAGGLA